MRLTQPITPQPTSRQRVIEGLAHVTRGMYAADDGSVWYIADGIHPGTELRCPLGRIGDRVGHAVIDSITVERDARGQWVWAVEVTPAPPEPAGSDEAAPRS